MVSSNDARARPLAGLAFGAALALAAGCAAGRRPGVESAVFGHTVEGRPIHGVVIRGESLAWHEGAAAADDGSGGPGDSGREAELETLLLFAAIHGNEPITALLLDRLVDVARRDGDLVAGKQLVVVPVANPDGLVRRSRENARGVDLNRNFPATSWRHHGRRHGARPASEPETRALVELVERYRPARILSVHAPLHRVDYDGPARGLAVAMGEACGYPVAKVGYATPGSFGSWAGVDRGIPVITLELRRDVMPAQIWDELGEAVLVFVRGP